MLEKNLISDVRKRADFIQSRLQFHFGQHPNVGDIRGRGFFWGLEFVENRPSKKPFDGSLKLAAKLKKAAFDEGLICYPMPGTRDGKSGDHVLLAPPFIATNEELEYGIECLVRALNNVI